MDPGSQCPSSINCLALLLCPGRPAAHFRLSGLKLTATFSTRVKNIGKSRSSSAHTVHLRKSLHRLQRLHPLEFGFLAGNRDTASAAGDYQLAWSLPEAGWRHFQRFQSEALEIATARRYTCPDLPLFMMYPYLSSRYLSLFFSHEVAGWTGRASKAGSSASTRTCVIMVCNRAILHSPVSAGSSLKAFYRSWRYKPGSLMATQTERGCLGWFASSRP